MEDDKLIEEIKRKFNQFFQTTITVDNINHDLLVKIYYKNYNDFESNIHRYRDIQNIFQEEFNKWIGCCEITGTMGNREYNMEFIANKKRWIMVNDFIEPYLDAERFGV